MNQFNHFQSSLPDDIALKIASSLQALDLWALGSCSRFWRQICGLDSLWLPLCKERWPSIDVSQESPASGNTNKGWRRFYVKKHNEIAGRVAPIVNFVERHSHSESLEVVDYLKAIEDLSSAQLGFVDVQVMLFKPKLSVLLNLVGLHYCIDWLQLPVDSVMEALQSCNISDRQVCVKWWKFGRWFYGFRLQDESHSRCVSLWELAISEEDEVLGVLRRGAIYEVLRVQISIWNPVGTSWSCQST